MHRLRQFVLVMVLVSAAGCNLTAAQPTAPATATDLPLPSTAPATVAIAPTDTLPPTDSPTTTAEPSPTSNLVTITAATAGINVRRGPSVAYNVVGGLQQGNSATALARNEEATWLFIPIPGNPSQNGWISTLGGYSTVQGNVDSLVIQPYPPPVAAYIRNCTFHPMLVKPGDVTLADQTQSPDNRKQFNPGEYRVYDQSVSNTEVEAFRLSEGDTIDITEDGLDNAYACP